jgi:hypothetical protein
MSPAPALLHRSLIRFRVALAIPDPRTRANEHASRSQGAFVKAQRAVPSERLLTLEPSHNAKHLFSSPLKESAHLFLDANVLFSAAYRSDAGLPR